VASTLLAVDDSVTMRKVLEITFAGPEFRIVTANSPDAALQKLKADKPDLIITDGTLEPKNGYELCKEIKRLFPTTPVLLLSSKQNPFDAVKGTASQVDDHMDKPFDTQQMIDKVKKLLSGQPVAGGTAKPVAVAQTTPSMPSPMVEPRPAAPVTVAAAKPAVAVAAAAPQAATPMQRAKTLIYNPPAPIGAPAPMATPAPLGAVAPIAARPITAVSPAMPRPTAQAAFTTTLPGPAEPVANHAAATPVGAQINGALAGKLEQLGLTAAQVEAVTALSRDIIERVVWEVVPVLAETIIKEELARLTGK
jgi:DNA-binding response OmpR family regulator